MRNPAKSAELKGPNVELAVGDFDHPATLDAALRGVDDLSVEQQLEGIALGMMRYFREVMPILMRLVTHMGGRVFICQFRGLLHVEYRVRNLQRHACMHFVERRLRFAPDS